MRWETETHRQGQQMICRSSVVHMTQFLRDSLAGRPGWFATPLLLFMNASHAIRSASPWPKTRFWYLRRVNGDDDVSVMWASKTDVLVDDELAAE